MQLINVQFADESEAKIVSYFAGPQDSAEYPNQGTVQTDDDRWKAFYETVSSEIRPYVPSPS